MGVEGRDRRLARWMGDSTARVTKHLTNIAIGIGSGVLVAATDHRWVRIWTPVVYVGSIFGLLLVLSPFGSVINGSRSWIVIGGNVGPAGRAGEARCHHRHVAAARRAGRGGADADKAAACATWT